MQKVTSYCVFAHSSLILVVASLIRKRSKSPRGPSDPAQPCALDWSPVAASRIYKGRHDTFEKPIMLPGHQLISQDSALVPVVSLSHMLYLWHIKVPTHLYVAWWKPEDTQGQPRFSWFWVLGPNCISWFSKGQPGTTGLRTAQMKATISCWRCGQKKSTPRSFHLGFTRETSSSLTSNLLLYFKIKNTASSEVLDPLSMTTATYFPSCSRKDLNPLKKLHAERNKMKQ